MSGLEGERLQKVLANQGKGSRREIERWIEEGRIKLNGQIARLGDRYQAGDRLHLDNKAVTIKGFKKPLILGLMYYKPEGEVTSRSDEKGRKTIFDSLPACEHGRWINVGRLDLNTSGLMLLTNNGELANRLMHPKYNMLREYAVRVLGDVEDEQLQAMLGGVELEDGEASFESIVDAGGSGRNHWYHVTLREGRHREVRRIWESQGLMVSRLIRIRYASIKLDKGMKAGEYRELKLGELNQLLNETGLPVLKGKQRGKKTTARKKQAARTGHARKSEDNKWPTRKPARKSARVRRRGK